MQGQGKPDKTVPLDQPGSNSLNRPEERKIEVRKRNYRAIQAWHSQRQKQNRIEAE